MARLLRVLALLAVAATCVLAGCNPPYDNTIRHASGDVTAGSTTAQ